jgi:hypothetical protein
VPPEQASIFLQLKIYPLTPKQLTNDKSCIHAQACCRRTRFGLEADDVFPFGTETGSRLPAPSVFVFIDWRWVARSYTAAFSYR